MKTKKYGIVGYKGKIGSLLIGRPDFIPVGIDITSEESVWKGLKSSEDFWHGKLNILVNCAGMSSISECEQDPHRAVDVNVSGLRHLHKVFGDRVLNLSSEQIYPSGIFAPKEVSTPKPLNHYGLTKVGAEAISNAFDGKTIRLSRTISITDPDILEFFLTIKRGNPIWVPVYMVRSYLTRGQAVDGIEWFVRHYDELPHIVNYGNLQRISYYTLVKALVKELGLDSSLVHPKFIPDKTKTPRPLLGGLNISLAKSLGFPMFSFSDTVSDLKDEYENLHSTSRL